MIVSRFGENVFRSTSINFGFIPAWYIGHNDVDQHTAGTRHSSPLLSFPFLSGLIKAKNAKRFADEPELTIKQYLDLIKFENFFSNSFVFFAIVILVLLITLIASFISLFEKAFSSRGYLKVINCEYFFIYIKIKER